MVMEPVMKDTFRHVSYLWDDNYAAKLAGDEVALLIYRSNLLGADLRLTNYAGGNTSCKTLEPDLVTGEEVPVLWVKGSGGDLGTLTRKGLAALYLQRLEALKKKYRGLAYEDEMVPLFTHCLYDPHSQAPSIDTPLHAFLPHKHVDHLHPDAVIAIAASKDGRAIMQEIYGNDLAWIDWQRPGFDLGLKMEQVYRDNPHIKGIILGGHGLFSWGETAYESYVNTLGIIEKAAAFLEKHYSKKRPVFGGVKVAEIPAQQRRAMAVRIMPFLRAQASSHQRMIGHFTDDQDVLEFVNSADLERLAPMGTSCPDHFLRTKIRPLVLQLKGDVLSQSDEELRQQLMPQFEAYRKAYTAYYEQHRQPDSPPMRDPNPVIILWPGVGMFAFAKDKPTARISAEFYQNAIHVMKGAEAVSTYVSLPEGEAFRIEYWQLEEAKLKRLPPEKPLSRKIAVITGGSGGIGRAIAEKLAAAGACVVISDIDDQALQTTLEEMKQKYGRDVCAAARADVRDEQQVREVFAYTILQYGGVDILVNCAGLSISKSLVDTTLDDWNILQDVLVKGQFLMSREAVTWMRRQLPEIVGCDIVNIVSKNALVAGPDNVAYGSAKAAQLHMSRLLAAELGKDKIRVNVVNPDAVIRGSKIWESGWAEGRAKAYGVRVEDLPAFYARRTLLNEEIHAEDIANAVFAFVGGLLSKSTGNVLNVDGGVAAAFVR
ncbi:rhamnulose-1-phosphate aldolase/alcohol dehydrogenase [Thermoflavifilum aggregans]|uniref:Rhamnulose-1-phosphate aldolase/alcohol dehydrogenase n=2 Tax=Thermoflavifilum aggregans TaxID=454188 RepID=A0A2M9CV07_9BACT|nr:rhamnulose-1-phosphate aldolase/alcohol dehydrogenase [Thermoflavifilum aggregans]